MNQRVLVCEDDRAIRLLLGKELAWRGLSTECVGTGVEAVARLRQRPYDLVLLDLAMPGMSGYEVVNVVQREQPYLLDRIIIVTAVQRAFGETLPVAAFLRKPFDLAHLDTTIQQVLSRSPLGGRGNERTHAEGELR
jgi:CheY-like chemotaxis protein